MFAVGDYVMKINNGVCRIDDITHLEMSGVDKDKLYYVMTPIESGKSTLYVSVDSADRNIRSAMTSIQAEEVINAIPQIEEACVSNDKLREQTYKDAVKSGKPQALVSVIKTIYMRKKSREVQGKKNTAIDERYFKQAEELLYAEMAFALGKTKAEIYEMISEYIKNPAQ